MDVYDSSIVSRIAPGIMLYMLCGLVVRKAMLARLPDGDTAARVAQYRAATLIALALVESGALVIITLGMISGSATWAVAGGAAGVGMMLLTRPSSEEAGFGDTE